MYLLKRLKYLMSHLILKHLMFLKNRLCLKKMLKCLKYRLYHLCPMNEKYRLYLL
jgi:hypothetical protein